MCFILGPGVLQLLTRVIWDTVQCPRSYFATRPTPVCIIEAHGWPPNIFPLLSNPSRSFIAFFPTAIFFYISTGVLLLPSPGFFYPHVHHICTPGVYLHNGHLLDIRQWNRT
jgi:hypothetical protein